MNCNPTTTAKGHDDDKKGWIRTTCPYCGVGCGIEARRDVDGQPQIRGDHRHPANFGALCSKGLALAETLVSDGRLLRPRIDGMKTDWDTALSHVAGQLKAIIAEHGPDAVAFYLSGQLLTEDYYVANKLMKGFIGSANVDTNSRLCMSSTVAGQKRAFGSDTMPGCYQDLEQADLLVLTGSNLAWCHPVLFQRIKAVRQRRAASDKPLRVVVIDPRRTASCELADLHLAIRPGGDVALFNGLLGALARGGRINQSYVAAHTEGLAAALASAASEQQQLMQHTGLAKEELNRFYQWFAETERVVTLYSQGVNQSTSGTDKVNSIINCHLATGRIGLPGAGPFSITGQPNAMGGREVGGLANTLAAHLEFGNAEHHALLADYWQAPALADTPGLKAVELFDAIERGQIKAVWIIGTNPAVSLPEADKVRRALAACPLVVVSDCVEATDTNRCANVLLPARGWSEKSGTVTNSERRISRQRAFMPAAGEARPDWQILCEVARKLGFDQGFDFADEAEIFAEYATLTTLANDGGRALDLGGLASLTRAAYERMTPQQWPVTQYQEELVQQRVFGDGEFYTASGKAQIVAVSTAPTPLPPAEWPMLLNTGRIRDQWHTMTRSGLSPTLSAHLPEPFAVMHPDEGARYGVVEGGLVTVRSLHGHACLRARLDPGMRRGELFAPIHWSEESASHGRIGSLVAAEVDPVSGQPGLKMTSVAVSPRPVASEALVLSRAALPHLALGSLAYWSHRRVAGGYLYRLASKMPPAQLNALVADLCDTGTALQQVAFDAPLLAASRQAAFAGTKLHWAGVTAPQLRADDWDWLQQLLDGPFDGDRQLSLLAGRIPESLQGGPIVCACKQVGKQTLCQAIKGGAIGSVTALSAATGAGTGCGSCLGELQQLIEETLCTEI